MFTRVIKDLTSLVEFERSFGRVHSPSWALSFTRDVKSFITLMTIDYINSHLN